MELGELCLSVSLSWDYILQAKDTECFWAKGLHDQIFVLER